MEILDVFIDIANVREQFEVRLALLERNLELCYPGHHKLQIYTFEVEKLKVKLHGYSKHSEYIEKYFAVAEARKPEEWHFCDFNVISLVVTDGSLWRAQRLIETLLPKVSRIHHRKLLFWLSKCYLSAYRFDECLKCVELSIQL